MKGVRTEHPAYTDVCGLWEKCRATAEGEKAVHAARELYLPRLTNEDDPSYNTRLAMTPFFNATWRTISGLRGMMFRKPPKIDVPEQLAIDMEDIDLAGTTMQGFAQQVAEDSLTVGRVGIMVDYPLVDASALTLADVASMGLRTHMALYKAETIINWRTVRVNGSTILSMVVLVEDGELAGGDEFAHNTEKQYRVLDLANGVYRQRLYRINDKDEDELILEFTPLMNNKPLEYIPFVFIGVDVVGPEVEDPPLIDLVTTNLKHYGQATSYERGCFFSGLPTMFISGYDDSNEESEIYVGGTKANCLQSSDARAYYVEVAGNFVALRQNLEDKKAEMAVLGARMLETQKLGVEAEGTHARRQVGEESLLAEMSQTISQGLTRALQWFADWQGMQAKVKYDLNRDFLPAKMDSATLTAMVGAWQLGGISKESLFTNLKQGELIAEDVTFEEEEARIANQAMMGSTPDEQAGPTTTTAGA
jgi:hypothetical protein